MRTEKQLFQLMLEYQYLFDSGLCVWVMRIRACGIIEYDEYYLLTNYLKENKPLDAEEYWFPYGEIAPRIKWIKQQIERL